MNEPTDKQLEDFAVEEQFLLFCDEDEFTQIARAVLAKWGAPAQAAPAAVAGPVEWRELAARVMDALADAQEQANSAYPAHASRYPAWEAHARWLRWHADMFRTGKPVGSGAGQPAVLAALAAAQAQTGAVPLTDEKAQELIELESWGPAATSLNAQLLRTIRRTEAAHGIKGGQHGTE